VIRAGAPDAEGGAARHAARFPPVPLFDIDRNFGGWKKAQDIFFADGGQFDQIYAAAPH
jgi:sulfate transport system substrate-binding protein